MYTRGSKGLHFPASFIFKLESAFFFFLQKFGALRCQFVSVWDKTKHGLSSGLMSKEIEHGRRVPKSPENILATMPVPIPIREGNEMEGVVPEKRSTLPVRLMRVLIG